MLFYPYTVYVTIGQHDWSRDETAEWKINKLLVKCQKCKIECTVNGYRNFDCSTAHEGIDGQEGVNVAYCKRQKLRKRKVLWITGFHLNVGKTFAVFASSVLEMLSLFKAFVGKTFTTH